MAIDKRISYAFGGTGGRAPGVGGSKDRGSTREDRIQLQYTSQPKKKTTPPKKKTTPPPGEKGGPGYIPPKKKTTPPGGGGGGGGAPTHIPKNIILKGRTYPGGIPGGAWKRHAEFTNYLKYMNAKNYHQTGGLDFKTRFSSIPNWAAKGLGYGYQGVTEGLRGLGKYLTGDPGAMSDAYSRALEEGRLNALGIEQFGTGSPLEQKYLAERDYYETLARGGLAGLYRYGGFI